MDILVMPDLLININQIAYVQRHAARPTKVTVYFAGGPSAGLDLEGANADQVIARLARRPGEEIELS